MFKKLWLIGAFGLMVGMSIEAHGAVNALNALNALNGVNACTIANYRPPDKAFGALGMNLTGVILPE